MSVIAEVEKLAFSLPPDDRAKLADRLWESLPEDYVDQEELELVMRRDREMDEDPSKVISHDEFLNFFEDHFKK
jgi:putative addiction module component (TIGR02574 family)